MVVGGTSGIRSPAGSPNESCALDWGLCACSFLTLPNRLLINREAAGSWQRERVHSALFRNVSKSAGAAGAGGQSCANQARASVCEDRPAGHSAAQRPVGVPASPGRALGTQTTQDFKVPRFFQEINKRTLEKARPFPSPSPTPNPTPSTWGPSPVPHPKQATSNFQHENKGAGAT